ncbi:MAG TPA: HEAT repeat domain-containing protein [bacterium]|nr:HEAT repeat domain-containing protein [bacterium]HPR88416.1 HEAT repeat domain-containing protein [bacterium]
MKPCPDMQLAITLYHANELDDAERLAVERHLAACPACRAAAERIGEIAALAAEQPGAPGAMARSATPAVAAEEVAAATAREEQLMTALQIRTASRVRSGRRQDLPLQLHPLYLALAAMLLVAFGFLLGRLGGRPQAPDPTLQALLTGFQPVVAAGHTVQPELLNVQRVRYDPVSGQIDIEYNTLNGVRLQGTGTQPQVQLMLARAMIESDNPALRLHAVKAAGAIAAQQQSLDDELLQAINYLLAREQNQGVRLMAVRVLRALPLSEAIKKMLLQIVLHDENPALRMEAFDGLASHAGGREIEPFLQTIAKDSSSSLRVKARALQQTIAAEPVRSAELSREN